MALKFSPLLLCFQIDHRPCRCVVALYEQLLKGLAQYLV